MLIGPNGLGKTMLIAKNLLHQAVLHGYTARFTLASDMLHDLAAQDSSTPLARRLRRYTSPAVLASTRWDTCPMTHATRICSSRSSRAAIRTAPSILTTNKPSANGTRSSPTPPAWSPSSIGWCTAEILTIDGKSYRLKEAKERAARNAKSGAAKKPKKP